MKREVAVVVPPQFFAWQSAKFEAACDELVERAVEEATAELRDRLGELRQKLEVADQAIQSHHWQVQYLEDEIHKRDLRIAELEDAARAKPVGLFEDMQF